MSCFRLLLAFALISLPTLAWSGESRGWTDNQGRTIQAEFVRVFNGTVILQQGTKVLQVPLSNLSPEDQAFVRNGGQEPSEENEPSAIDGPTTPEQRNWTDRKGNQIQATFVRLHENQVVLSAGGRVKSIGIEQFSDADHDYVKQLLTAQGQQAEAAALDQYLASQTQAGNANPGNIPPGAAGPAIPSLAPANSFMEKQLAESRRRMEEQQRQMEERMEQQRLAREAQQQNDLARQQREAQERRERDLEQQRQREEMLANNPIPSGPSSIPTNAPSDFPEVAYTPTGPGGDSDFYYEEVYECSNCLKEVPAHLGAGSSCPHCGITFDYVEDASGNRTYRDGYAAGGIGFIVLTVIGIGIRVMIAMARS